jgi:hypothetical protein
MKFVTPGDLDIAEKYFDLALEKDPSYAPAYAGRAWVWLVRNQWSWSPPEEAGPKAKAAALRAIELDENSAGAHEAIAAAREGQRVQPEFPIAANALWWIMHEKKGMEREAFEAVKVYARVSYNDPRIESALDEGYAQGGYAEAMKRGAEFLIARLPEVFCKPSEIGTYYAIAWEKDKAIEWLGKGLDIHDSLLPYLGYPLFVDLLGDEPWYQDLLRKIGLPVDEKE